MKKLSLAWTVFIVAIVWATAAMAVTETEREALIALYISTDGDNWTDKTGWKTPPLDTDGFAMPGSECSTPWYGITCDDTDSSVQWLYLDNNELTGNMPPTLGNLTGLTVLNLSINNLTGPIPSEIRNLANLEELALVNNQLGGSIPSEIGNLTSLNYIYLQGNRLTGPIPSEIGKLINLNNLNLGQNQLTGPIPSEIGKLINLNNLYLGQNQLTGSIPVSMGNLINLTTLELQDNRLTGNIPASFQRLPYECEVNISNNCLTGCFENASQLTLVGEDIQDETCQLPLIPGDINGDTSVDIQDAILILKISINNVETGIQINDGADLNCDNVMGFEETIYVLQSTAELRQ